MAHVEQRYAPCRRSALAVWLTAVAAPALLGWAFWSATASPASPPPQHVIVSADPTVVVQVGFHHR